MDFDSVSNNMMEIGDWFLDTGDIILDRFGYYFWIIDSNTFQIQSRATRDPIYTLYVADEGKYSVVFGEE
jgi:hypothetical protein